MISELAIQLKTCSSPVENCKLPLKNSGLSEISTSRGKETFTICKINIIKKKFKICNVKTVTSAQLNV